MVDGWSHPRPMTPHDFRTWRKGLGLSQKQAADALGLKNRIVQYYEKGERDGEKVKIPKHVRLACYGSPSASATITARPRARPLGGGKAEAQAQGASPSPPPTRPAP